MYDIRGDIGQIHALLCATIHALLCGLLCDALRPAFPGASLDRLAMAVVQCIGGNGLGCNSHAAGLVCGTL